MDLTDSSLPGSRFKPRQGVVWVPAFTDLKPHDITSGPGDPNAEAIDINHPGGSARFFEGNCRFLTKKLWGAANERPYFHHGLFTTLREATLALAAAGLFTGCSLRFSAVGRERIRAHFTDAARMLRAE